MCEGIYEYIIYIILRGCNKDITILLISFSCIVVVSNVTFFNHLKVCNDSNSTNKTNKYKIEYTISEVLTYILYSFVGIPAKLEHKYPIMIHV